MSAHYLNAQAVRRLVHEQDMRLGADALEALNRLVHDVTLKACTGIFNGHRRTLNADLVNLAAGRATLPAVRVRRVSRARVGVRERAEEYEPEPRRPTFDPPPPVRRRTFERWSR